ncbi:MAG: DUF3365 domain-containing protein [Gammaproteobacteria bacterium]|jgi:hypothetical protein|nr:DUF3365 domain-containing protein [Gammaproteobacteria bacterium]MBT3488541.1 DUF3365 domain-containing protein [Gammaproteobacteria bacterium]MBT3719645.1 DUF3365 domain-containing protein [Gammaproteobacteria bacterium]MBT3843728.1 DUF3365 domain-containing protein [Gammaproteobacteria bacterium]MBT3892284.1 DUF3365 domain-containing protein [Gammaproteobacteria bacterium]
MKKALFSTILTVSLASSMNLANADEISTNVAESREAVKTLFTKLKGALVTGMKTGGPTAAIAACSQQAQPITDSVSDRRTGLEIRRISLRLRNPDNAADAWEIKILQQFEARSAAGESLATMEHHEVVKQKGGEKLFRYMKAIPASKPCMVCHGELIATDVLQKIRAVYPLDQATGFKPGDLRGAFSVTKALN